MPENSDYIVYVDESGDHGLKGIDPEFPAFCLSFCIVKKSIYSEQIVPAFQQFKFRHWGHDNIILHEHEIRKHKGEFSFLRRNPSEREAFFEELNTLMRDAAITIVGCVIDKPKLVAKYGDPWNPYETAMHMCLERVLGELLSLGEEDKLAHVVFESRGPKEDKDLEIEFRRVCSNQMHWGYRSLNFDRMKFEPKFVSKKANSTGLQLADLIARPIAIRYLRPKQENRAYDIIKDKSLKLKFFP